MLDSVKYILGNIEVKEENNLISITGINAKHLVKQMGKNWGISVVNNVFSGMGNYSLSFYSFFAVEVLFMLYVMQTLGHAKYPLRLIKELISLIENNTWVKKTLPKNAAYFTLSMHYDRLDRFNIKPFAYQSSFFEHYSKTVLRYNLNGMLLDSAPGTGKTITSLMLGQLLGADHTVVISPKNAIYRVWETDIRGRIKNDPTLWISDKKQPYHNEEFLVFHYEDLATALTMVRHLKGRIVIILDESHNLNEISSLRTQLFIDLCTFTPNVAGVLWQSGTPIKALGKESIPILRTIDPLFTIDVENAFKRIFGTMGKRGLGILQHRMGIVKYRIEKDIEREYKPIFKEVNVNIPNSEKYTLPIVGKELKDYVEKQLHFYLSNMESYISQFEYCLDLHRRTLRSEKEHEDFSIYLQHLATIRKGYNNFTMRIETTYCNNYEDTKIIPSLPKDWAKTFTEISSIVKYVKLKVMGEALGNVLTKRRINCFLDLVKYSNMEEIINSAEKKTLIFTSYVEVLKSIVLLMEEGGFKPLAIYQDTNKNLNNLMKQFDEHIEINPLCATYKSLSTAVPVTSANTMILVDTPFRDYIFQQAISRIDRIGQDSPTFIFSLLLDTGGIPNVSTRSLEIMEWSRNMVEEILGVKIDHKQDISIGNFHEFIEHLMPQ